MSLYVKVPVFCAGQTKHGYIVSRDMLGTIPEDRFVPVLYNHKPDQIVGVATGFIAFQDRLWAQIHLWHPRYIASVKNGDKWQLSAALCKDKFEIDEISLVEEGYWGDRCALPVYRKAA